LVIAAGPGAIGHFVSTWPLRWVPANVPPLLQLAIPFFASALAWLILHQSIRPGHVIGGSITMLGVAGALRSPAGRRLVAGDAVFHGSTGALRLQAPIVGMAPTPSGRGYWLVASDGGVFRFGDATFWGSAANQRHASTVAIVPLSNGTGYWLVDADGTIWSF